MIAKRHSTRLPNKNILNFKGKPMFQWNLEKLLNTFSCVVFDSDNPEMLNQAVKLGAIPHEREKNLRGHNVPSVPIFKSIRDKYSKYSFIINVQANSPNVDESTIYQVAKIAQNTKVNEILTMYSDHSINGSVWGISEHRLNNYKHYHDHKPDILILDNSPDIHTQLDFDNAHNLNNGFDIVR